jgi:hypothetical protein
MKEAINSIRPMEVDGEDRHDDGAWKYNKACPKCGHRVHKTTEALICLCCEALSIKAVEGVEPVLTANADFEIADWAKEIIGHLRFTPNELVAPDDDSAKQSSQSLPLSSSSTDLTDGGEWDFPRHPVAHIHQPNPPPNPFYGYPDEELENKIKRWTERKKIAGDGVGDFFILIQEPLM